MKQILLAILFIVSGVLIGQSSAWEEGIESYKNSEYLDAVKKWESLSNEGLHSVELYYNLGNAYYRTNDFFNARLNYEKALLLGPSDPDVKYNIELTKKHFQDKDVYLPSWDLTTIAYLIQSKISSIIWFALSLLVLVMILILSMIKRNLPNSLKISGITLSAFLFVFSFLIDQKASQFQEALVSSSRVVVRSSPTESGNKLFVLHQGSKLRILEESGDYFKVELSSEKQGWMKIEHLSIVEL